MKFTAGYQRSLPLTGLVDVSRDSRVRESYSITTLSLMQHKTYHSE